MRFSRRFVALSLVILLVLVAAGALIGHALLAGGGHTTGAHVAQVAPISPTQEQLAQDVSLNIWHAGVKSLTTTYDAQRHSATVTITMGASVPNTTLKVSAAQELTKALCLMALQALWTSGVALDQTTVLVQGLAQSIYGEIITQVYGKVILKAATAHRIAWDTITADAAWSAYDFAFLQNDFVLNDILG